MKTLTILTETLTVPMELVSDTVDANGFRVLNAKLDGEPYRFSQAPDGTWYSQWLGDEQRVRYYEAEAKRCNNPALAYGIAYTNLIFRIDED